MAEYKRKKIIYLPRWYPNKFDSMPGLFIQRHAEAANIYCDIGVVYVQSVDYCKTVEKYEFDNEIVNGVPTIKVYYRNPSYNIPLISQLHKSIKFYKANFRGINLMKNEIKGLDYLHIHILTRLGLIGLYYKWFHAKKYFISEHWSRYLDLTQGFKGGIRKALTKVVVRNATAVTTVTENLANAMRSHGLANDNYIVMPNVVSSEFMEMNNITKVNNIVKNIIHVSCFEDKSKNISGILNVARKLSDKRKDFRFTMIGDGMDFIRLKDYSDDLKISKDIIQFTGLLEGNELVKQMKTADILLIFSNYENFPVVINESFSLGIPVMATRVGGIPENVDDYNGVIVNPGDEEDLLDKLNQFLDNNYQFDNEKIMSKAKQKFSLSTIGKQLLEMYSI